MKRMIVVIGLLCCGIFCCAQNWGEWMQQCKTQRGYLLAQLAALQTYAKLAVNGYTVTRDGMQVVSAIRKGEFDLHTAFFGSLARVNKVLQTYPGVVRMLQVQEQILRGCDRQAQRYSGYVQLVYQRLRVACCDNRDALQEVLTDHALQLTDDERIKRIEGLARELTDLYSFFQDFDQRVCGNN